MFKSKFRVYSIVILAIICIILILRNIIFLAVFEKTITKTENRFGLDITYNNAKLLGLRTIVITQLNIKSKDGAPVINSDSIVVAVKPLNLIIGDIRFGSLSIFKTKVWLNYEFLKILRQRTKSNNDTTTISKGINYAQLINSTKNRVFEYMPKTMVFRNLDFYYQNQGAKAIIRIENFNYENASYIGDLLFIDNQITKRCITQGTIDKSANIISCKLSHDGNSSLRLPYLGPRWQASLGFDTLEFHCAFTEDAENNTYINGKIKTDKLAVYYKSIGPDTVITNYGALNFNIKVNSRSIELDSSSVAQLNTFRFSPYLKFEKHSSPKITFAFIKETFQANDLFSSLPDGLFANFKGLKTSGKLEYQMRMSVDMSMPDSVTFYSNLESKEFSIQHFGVTDFRLLNASFNHEVYENNSLVASFQVGSDNPDFVPLNEISPYLKYSILTSEDGDFFYHHGFNMNAFRESIAKNIKEKRFARGGSTISMQLIKNVFLNRKKTYSRKLEEALIVWMIETQHLVSKERMFEVYLNIIEWGPGIYGIKPAAWFYFKKQPKDLTLSESIYLTSIIPRPKGFRYMFDQDGKPRAFLIPYYKLLSSIMVRRNQIMPEDTIDLQPIRKLTGEAMKFLEKPDSTLVEDSLFYIKPLEISPVEL